MRPYGMWTVADGRQVLFNRNYRPILERYPGAPAKAVIEFRVGRVDLSSFGFTPKQPRSRCV